MTAIRGLLPTAAALRLPRTLERLFLRQRCNVWTRAGADPTATAFDQSYRRDMPCLVTTQDPADPEPGAERVARRPRRWLVWSINEPFPDDPVQIEVEGERFALARDTLDTLAVGGAALLRHAQIERGA